MEAEVLELVKVKFGILIYRKQLGYMLFLSTLILSTNFFYKGETYGQSENSQYGWWNNAWQFRVPLMTVNSLNESVINQPVFFYIEIPQTHLFSAVKELRIIDRNGFEIPSYVLYEFRQAQFTLGVYVLSFLAMPPNSASVFHIYYGNPDASQPAYRSTEQKNVIIGKFTQINLQNPAYSDIDIELIYGKMYELTTSTKISYGTVIKSDFGSSSISNQKFRNVQGWSSLGNLTTYRFDGARTILKAGDITLVRSLVVQGPEVLMADLIINEEEDAVNKANYYYIINGSRLNSLGISQGTINPISDLAITSIAGTFIGVKCIFPIHNYQVSDTSSLIDNINKDSLNQAQEYSGTISFAFNHRVNVLNPGDHVELIRAMSIDSNMTQLAYRLETISNSIRTYFLAEEVLETPLPIVTIGYETTMYLERFTLSSDDFTIDVNNEAQIASPAHVKGQISYGMLKEVDRSFNGPNSWRTSSYISESGRSIASSSYWQDPEKEHVGYISIWDNLGIGKANASLSTPWIHLPSVTTAYLNITYRADYASYGNVLPPTFYLSICVDYNSDNQVDQSIYLPISDSKLPLDASMVAILKGDCIWRQLIVDITDLLEGEYNQAKIDIFGSIDAGFKGRIELSIDNIQIQVVGNVDKLIEVVTDYHNQMIKLKGMGDMTNIKMTGNIEVIFIVLKSHQLNVLPDGVFESIFFKPIIDAKISSSSAKEIKISPSVIVLMSAHIDEILALKLGNIILEVDDYQIHDGSLSITERILERIMDDQLDFEAKFRSGSIQVKVHDAGGNILSGTLVQLKDVHGNLILAASTGSEGYTTFRAVPADYIVQFFYHDSLLSESSLRMSSETSLSVQLEVFNMKFKALDQLGFPIEDATVHLTSNNGTIYTLSQTGSDGMTDLIHVAGKRSYEILVFAGGNQVLKQTFIPSLDGVTLLLNTSYIPYSFILIMGTLFTGLVALTVFVMRRRLPQPQKNI